MLTPPRVWGQLGDPNDWVILRGLPFLGRTKSKSCTVDLFSKLARSYKHKINILYNKFTKYYRQSYPSPIVLSGV